jgi:hypothetical protein
MFSPSPRQQQAAKAAADANLLYNFFLEAIAYWAQWNYNIVICIPKLGVENDEGERDWQIISLLGIG